MRTEPRLGDLVLDAAAHEVVGRGAEIDRLAACARPGAGPSVVFVSGPGGIGKSMVLRGFVERMTPSVLVVDGHQVEPTPEAFLVAVHEALESFGTASAKPDPGPARSVSFELTTLGVADDLAAKGVTVLAVDGFERLNLLDGWLRNDLLPALPSAVTTLLVGRRPPNLAWKLSPGWRALLHEVVIGPMREVDARELVRRRQVPQAAAERAIACAHGHPLALVLAADAFIRHPALTVSQATPAEVVEELCDGLLDDLDVMERRLVEAASVLRVVTQPQLAAVLNEADEPDELAVPGVLHGSAGGSPHAVPDLATAWRVLRQLPFTSVSRSGIEMDEVARQMIGGALEIRDSARVRQLRRRAARAALRSAVDGRSWDATADLLYLVQNPVIRDSYLPPGERQHPVESATAQDLAAILTITEAHDGPGAAAITDAWWRRHQDSFVVARGADGAVDAYSVVVPLSALDRRLADTDPVLAAFLEHLVHQPIRSGEEVLLHRRALGRRRGELPTPEQGAMVVDLKRLYFQLRPGLSRVYTAVTNWKGSGAGLGVMGFRRSGDPLSVGSTTFFPYALDFGPGSVDGWLLRHVLDETDPRRTGTSGRPEEAASMRPSDHSVAREEMQPSVVLRLSAREREVLAVLAEGSSNAQIAARLFISERTVNRHLSNIFAKLEVRNRTAAARIAVEAGLAG